MLKFVDMQHTWDNIFLYVMLETYLHCFVLFFLLLVRAEKP